MNRRVNANLAVFALGFIVMMLWLASNVVSFDRVDKPYELTADFDNAFGVLANAEVSYLGVPFGHVSKVDRITDGVRITMSIDRGREIPRGSTANIQRKSAIGEQYIDFYAPKNQLSAGTILRDGDHIPKDQTTVPLEFSELLRSASALLSEVTPGDVGTIVHEVSTGVQGRADSLRSLAVEGDKLASVLASRTAALDRIAINGGKLTAALADHRSSLGASIDNLAALNNALAEAKGDLATVLARGGPLVQQVAELIGNHKAELDCDLRVLEAVVDLTTKPERLAGLRALLTWAPVAFAGVWDARDLEAEGIWVRVGMIQSPIENPPVFFNPAKDLPPVEPAPDCVSTIPPSGVDYVPGAAAGPKRTSPLSGLAVSFGMAAAVGALVVRSATKLLP